MFRALIVLASVSALAGCSTIGFQPGGQALISGHTPADANSATTEPQPANSLPPGAEGNGAGSVTARQSSYGALTITPPHL